MKRFAALGLVLILIFSVTGCGKDITLTSEENDLIAEYIAGAMLKHSYDNEWNYQKLRNAQKSQGGSSQNNGTQGGSSHSGISGGSSGTGTNTGGNSSTADTMSAMTAALGLDSIQLTYSTYSVGDRYPTGEYVICVPANEGCKVAAFEFELKNISETEVTANTISSGLTLKLSVGDKTIAQSVSLLKNDLIRLSDIEIAAGETYTAVAVFQVPEAIAENMSGLTLTAYINGSAVGKVPGL